jgi:hypothetical protein
MVDQKGCGDGEGFWIISTEHCEVFDLLEEIIRDEDNRLALDGEVEGFVLKSDAEHFIGGFTERNMRLKKPIDLDEPGFGWRCLFLVETEIKMIVEL